MKAGKAQGKTRAKFLTAYHVGPSFRKFDLGKAGSGEGSAALGPGIYLATSQQGALPYKKYVRDPGGAYLYRVRVSARGLYDPVRGMPVSYRKRATELATRVAGRDDYDRGVNPLRHGPGAVGAVFRHLQADAGRRALRQIGITGVRVLLNGYHEIAVYDLSAMHIVGKQPVKR